MKGYTRHIRCFLGMAAILLCMVVCRAYTATGGNALMLTAGAVGSMHEEHDATCALLCEKESDMLNAVHEMGRWGMSPTSPTLQGAVGRVLTSNMALQRMVRMLGALLTNEPSSGNGLAEALHHTLSTKRFYAGYYIYYRCQMRC